MKFENAIKKLEEISKKMESGSLSLDESLKLYQEAVNLGKVCSEQLEQAKGKITQLVGDKFENFEE